MASFSLHVLEGPERGRAFPLPPGAALVVGREADCSLSDPFVSGKHCRLSERKGRVSVRDLGSRNGTFRNGLPLDLEADHELSAEDLVRVGATTFRVVREGASKSPPDARDLGGQLQTVELQERAGAKDAEEDSSSARPLPVTLLRALGNALGSPCPTEELAEACLQASLTDARWTRICLCLLEPEPERFFEARAFPDHPLFADAVDRAIAQNAPALVADVPLDPTSPGTPPGQLFASAAAVPVGFGPGGKGWLYVDTLGSNRALRVEDLPSLTGLARLLAGAIVRIRRRGDPQRAWAVERAGRQFLGESAPVKHLLSQVARLAQTDATVLLVGESGTGKEILARLLHDSGSRKDAPFVPLNCAALPEGLAESILFGHVRGAFTDAREDRLGLFRESGEGTVFLDEVGELPPAVQAKLLRALDNREVVPVGTTRPVSFQARIVAATHRDLGQEVRQGRFREDLAFRLNGVTLSVPPLRERGEDVLLLAQVFLERAGGKPRRFSRQAQLTLRSHEWPGNVRELKHVVEGAALLTDREELDAADLPFSKSVGPPTDGLGSLKELEKAHIVEVLRRTKGNKSRAARLLGVDRSTLYDKIRQHGLA